MASAVRRIAAPRDQLAALELVEKSDDIAWIQAQRVREGLLARRSFFAKELQRDEVTRAKAAGFERCLEFPTTDAGEMLEQRQEPLVARGLGCGLGHTGIIHQ